MKASEFAAFARNEFAALKRPTDLYDLGKMSFGYHQFEIDGETCWLLDDAERALPPLHGTPLPVGDGRLEGVEEDSDVDTLVLVKRWGAWTDYTRGDVRFRDEIDDLYDTILELDIPLDRVMVTSFYAHIDDSMWKYISKPFMRSESLYRRRCFRIVERLIDAMRPKRIIIFGNDLFVKVIVPEAGMHESMADQATNILALRWNARLTVCRPYHRIKGNEGRIWGEGGKVLERAPRIPIELSRE